MRTVTTQPVVLRAREKTGTTSCSRCGREGKTSGIEPKLLRPPLGWWLLLAGQDGPPYFFLLCPPCAAEAAGNQGEFIEADRTKKKGKP